MSHRIVLPVTDFALDLLPEQARERGSPEFAEAVLAKVVGDYASRQLIALVTIDDENLYITECSEPAEAVSLVMPLLKTGDLATAVRLLEQVDKMAPNDATVLYNLGLAYSELGQLDEAILRLKRCVKSDPEHANAWVGLGTAYERMKQLDASRLALERAVALEPENGFAQRNLGAVLGQLDRTEDAIRHLRLAYHVMPGDAQVLYGLAFLLLHSKAPSALPEADKLLQEFLARHADHMLAERAREMRTDLAHRQMRAQTGGFRPDVMFYLVDALQRLEAMGPAKARQVTLEIALLGRTGLDINNADKKYRLNSMPGAFSGLNLLAYMYAGLKQMDPTADAGVDFAPEYETALQMWEAKKRAERTVPPTAAPEQ
jgi:Flp pilus assembly protein TadD